MHSTAWTSRAVLSAPAISPLVSECEQEPNPADMRNPRLRSALHLLCLAFTVAFVTSTRATITNIVWYRLGENDPGAAPGLTVTHTIDLIGLENLNPLGTPVYTNDVSTSASNNVGSSLAVQFNGSGQILSNGVVSTATANFGIEAWVKPNVVINDPSADFVIAYNGKATADGWGLRLSGTNYVGLFGGVTSIGSATAVAGTWTHLALVRAGNVNTFYVNGVSAGTHNGTPITPSAVTDGFIIGGATQPTGSTFNGEIDEVRVFTFGTGGGGASQFSTNDLLFNLQQVSTAGVVSFTSSNATLAGVAYPPGLPTSAWFQWGTTTNYGNLTPALLFSGLTGSTSFNGGISNLLFSTTYHFRAAVSNSLGVATGTDVSFTTAGPSVQTLPANGIDVTTATLNGALPGGSSAASVWFQWGTTTGYGNVTPVQVLPANGGGFGSVISNLLANTTYQFVAVVSNNIGAVTGSNLSFTTLLPLSVTTLPANGIGANSATLNATANPGGASSVGSFEYGATTNYGTTTATQSLGSGVTDTNFSQTLISLIGGTTYHYRADAARSVGSVAGNDQTFLVPLPPIANTMNAGPLHPGQAILNANINPNGAPVAYWFEHGPTPTYGNFTPINLLAGGTSLVAVSNLITDLPRGSSYHFRVVASNSIGQSVGGDKSFTVPQGSTVSSGTTGGGQPFDIRQPSLELNYMIGLAGIFPSRNIAESEFVAQVRLFAGNFAPAGWALCQGQLMSISNNTALFSLIGTFYGGDGINTFALPDLRACTTVNVGQGAGLRPWVIGGITGEAQHALLVNEIPAHTHTLPPPDSLTGATGGGQPRNNIQPSLALTYVVQLVGIFPNDGGTDVVFEPFLGQVTLFAGNFAQTGTAMASGQLLPIVQDAALFSLLGTNYGGNGVTTFGLPDLQGRVSLGIGQGPTSAWSLGQKTGVESVIMTTAQMPAHQHTVPSLGIVTGFTGSNQPQTLMQPSLAIQYLICTNGEVPSTSVQAVNQMIGEIQIYAGTNVPVGWVPCDGSLLQIANSPTLFGVISNYFGGDGITTFALPNLSGRIPVGTITGQPGASYGAEQTVLTVANLPPHTHTVPALDFDRWITSFGLGGATAAFSADADADGENNGYEWATGTIPTNGQSFAPLTISPAGNNVSIGFPRNTNATDVIFTLQRSTNLANPIAWTGIATYAAGAWNPPAIVTETGSSNGVIVNVSDTRTNGPFENYRLEITWP